jgi:hypothetical protein
MMIPNRVRVQKSSKFSTAAPYRGGELGRDVTGAVVRFQIRNASEAIAAKHAVYDRAFATARAVLVSVALGSSFDVVHNVLRLSIIAFGQWG